MELPEIGYQETERRKRIEAWSGINLRDGASDGELTGAKNMSTRRYPALAPRKERALYSAYVRPTALFAWDNLLVVDGTSLIYRGEVVGTVLEGEKQFAVVNTKLIVWPDKCILDLQTGTFTKMEKSLEAIAGTASFSENTLTITASNPELGTGQEAFPFSSTDPKYTKVCTAVSWNGSAWVKTGETEKTVKDVTVGDYLIPSVSAITGAPTIRIRKEDEQYAEENTEGKYFLVTSVSAVGTTECKWEKFNCAISYYTYYMQGGFTQTETGNANTYSFTGYSGYRFNSSTGEFSNSGSLITVGEGKSGTVYHASGSSLMRISVSGSTYVISTCNSSGPYTSASYYKGNISYGYVYAEKDTYPGNGRYATDGYWYVLIGETGFDGTVTIAYEIYGTGNKRFSDVFEVGERVSISGCVTTPGNNVDRAIIKKIEDYKLTFADGTFAAQTTEAGTVRVYITVPDMDYICASNNRLWGVCNAVSNEIWNAQTGKYETVTARAIYASALGLPARFWDYDGLDSDSYAVAVGTDGDFTGIIDYSGSVLCWKEDVLHRVVGDYPSNYYLYTDAYYGLQKGSSKSLVIINEVLYYKGRDGVYIYTGGQPSLISYAFGQNYYNMAVAGAHGAMYYISMHDKTGAPVLYVYDTLHQIWTAEDELDVTDFAELGGELFALCDNIIYAIDEGNEPVEWRAELAAADEGTFSHKQYRWLMLDAELAPGAVLQIRLSADGGRKETVLRTGQAGRRVFRIPLRYMRCQRLAVELSGKGDVVIRSLQRTYITGSEEV